MGNCSPKPKPKIRPDSPVRVYGSESNPLTHRIRLSLLYKSIPFTSVPSPSEPYLQIGRDTIIGPADSLLQHIDTRFGGAAADPAEDSEAARAAVELQHQSMERHVAGMGRWAVAMAAGEGVGPRGGRRLGEWYGKWVELMQEHAQMEELLLFPALQRAADSDVCRKATEEHGRDLPLMNGIKEDIKSLVAMEAGTPFYQEALMNLSLRFKTLQEHCKEHFAAEEKQLLPLLQLAEKTRREEGEEPWSPSRWCERVMSSMDATHSSRLFPFFAAGLLPGEALRYIDLVCRCTHEDSRVVDMLRSLAGWIEGMVPMSWIGTAPFLKPH